MGVLGLPRHPLVPSLRVRGMCNKIVMVVAVILDSIVVVVVIVGIDRIVVVHFFGIGDFGIERHIVLRTNGAKHVCCDEKIEFCVDGVDGFKKKIVGRLTY
ncbi:hypothetical protein Tco_1193079 [Tanacetum coccineum]